MIPQTIYTAYDVMRRQRGQATISAEAFQAQLTRWYGEFQLGDCSLGYTATQLGIGQIDLIYLLDQLGWKATNL